MSTPLILDLDDDDTTPTENADVLRELTTTSGASALTVVEWGAATSAGTRRRVNEDAWGHRGNIFVVTDGMGGRGGGALAARTAIDRFLVRAELAGVHPDWQRIAGAVNVEVIRVGQERGIDRLGTTLVAAVVGGPLVTLIHLGDSRAYRHSVSGEQSHLDLLTVDHTVRSELLAAGLDVREYRERGVALHGLTSFIGLDPDILRVDVLAVPVRPGDRFLLCTDGIHRQLDDDQLRAELAGSSCRQVAEHLVQVADRVSGRDNATAIVFELGASDAARSAG